MGWSQRTVLVTMLLVLLLSTWAPAVEPGTFPVEPQELVLPGKGEAVIADLSVINDSVILSASLEVRASPTRTTVVTPAGRATTIAYEGGSSFKEPQGDYVDYLESRMEDSMLDGASSVDAEYATTVATDYAYQLYLIDVEVEGIDGIAATWRGQANHGTAEQPLYGADLYIYNNGTALWELVGSYNHSLAIDRVIEGTAQGPPWQYVNRTLPGDDKVVLLVMTQKAGVGTLATDSLAVTAEYLHFPRPRLDVGDDGMVDWGFGTSDATGAMGRVSAFDDGRSTQPISLPQGGGHNDSAALLVPPGSSIERAFLEYVPYTTQGSREASDVMLEAEAGADSPPMTVGSIPLLAHQTVSHVRLISVVKHNVTDLRMESIGGINTVPVGDTIFGPRSAAQGFIPDHNGVLRGVDVYINGKTGGPFVMDVELWSVSGGLPQEPALTSGQLHSDTIVDKGWYHVPLSDYVVTQGNEYAIVLMVKQAQPMDSVVLPINETDPYFNGSAYGSPTLNGQAMMHLTGDLAFRTYMDMEVNAGDAANLTVLGESGRKVLDFEVEFDVIGHGYQGRNWTFNLHNGNPFKVSFGWWARTYYILFAESPSLDVGDDGSVEWTGENVSTVQVVDIAAGLQRVVDLPDWPHVHVDLFGNTLYRVPINVSATSEGAVALNHLVVDWNATLTTPDLAPRLNALKATLTEGPGGMVKVPLNVTSRSAGRLNVTALNIEYDLPPTFLPFDDIDIPEDGEMEPLELDTLTFDDHHNNDLEYTVVREVGDEDLTYELTEDNLLSFSGPANWSGSSTFHVTARDGRDLVNRSRSFTVTIYPVDDPPQVSGIPSNITVVFGRARVIPIAIVDNDTPLANISIGADSPRVTGSAVCGTVRFAYPEGSSPETVTITVSDDSNDVPFMVRVTLIESDEPPVVTFPPEVHISLDRKVSMNLTLYVTDMESEADEMVWALVSSPDSLIAYVEDGHVLHMIPVASAAGQHVVVLSVTDPDGNTVTVGLNVTLVVEDNRAPVIKRGADAIPAIVKVERGKTIVINLALNDYWYDREDYNRPEAMRWEVQTLRPSLFTVEVDSNHRLSITALDTTGSGYMTLRLFDSALSASNTESVQVRVVEPRKEGSGWWVFAIASAVLVLVVLALAAISRRRAPDGARRPVAATPAVPSKVEVPAVPAAEKTPVPAAAEEEEVPARLMDAIVIHESTSLVAQVWAEGEEAISDAEKDELIEMSTLFAQERFEDAKVGAIKAFRFKGDEVLVAKGMNYFLAARCTGNQFDDVATEMKRSIVNVDVGAGEQLRKWYPGQKVAALEDELRALLQSSR